MCLVLSQSNVLTLSTPLLGAWQAAIHDVSLLSTLTYSSILYSHFNECVNTHKISGPVAGRPPLQMRSPIRIVGQTVTI